jgi:hypothetical protein
LWFSPVELMESMMLNLDVLVAPEPKKIVGVTRGGVMHRFATDKSIREYCKEQGMVAPSISDAGAVYAIQRVAEELTDEVQIGWVA